MSDRLREQIIKYKLDKEKAFYISLSDFNNEDILFDRLAAELCENSCIIVLSGEGVLDKNFLKTGEKVKQLCAEFDGTLVVCSRADIAHLTDADGLLLDDTDIPPEKAHLIAGHNMLLGYCSENSCENLDFIVYSKRLTVHFLNKIINLEELK